MLKNNKFIIILTHPQIEKIENKLSKIKYWNKVGLVLVFVVLL